MNFMNSLPSFGSGFGGIAQLQCDTLSSMGSLPPLGSLSSLPSGIEPPPENTSRADDCLVPATIQTVQPESFVRAAPLGGSTRQQNSQSTKAKLAAFAQKRKELKAQERRSNDLTPKGSIGKIDAAQRKQLKQNNQKKQINKQTNKKAKRAPVSQSEKKAPVGPWTKEEDALLKKLVKEHGEGRWDAKAATMGTGRTAKAVHTRWSRAKGNIIDPPRGGLKHEMTSMDAERQAKIMEESGYLLPVLTGSLAAAFGQS